MKIFTLFRRGEVYAPGVWQEDLDTNPAYSASVIHVPAGAEVEMMSDPILVQSMYILEGSLEVRVSTSQGVELEKNSYTEYTGWSLLPGQAQYMRANTDSLVFSVVGKVNPGQLTDRTGKNPILPNKINNLSDYTVTKPWGSEGWLVENGVYVLKGITMTAGSECSLQLHERKTEINLILSGSAKVSVGYDDSISKKIICHREAGEEQATFSVNAEELPSIKNSLQSRTIGRYEGWKSQPFQIHQVLSLETYFALEVSTPEVDDIIRLKDLYNRPGGRIASEHANPKV